MVKENKIKFTKIIVLVAILVYLILNIVSALFVLPVYASINQSIAFTLIVLLCNALIYIFLKNRIINRLFLFYWIFQLIFILGMIGRLFYPFSLFFKTLRRVYGFCNYLYSANMMLYVPGATNFYGATITNGTILLIITSIILILLYIIKISKHK